MRGLLAGGGGAGGGSGSGGSGAEVDEAAVVAFITSPDVVQQVCDTLKSSQPEVGVQPLHGGL